MFKRTRHHLLMGLAASAVLTVSAPIWSAERTPGWLVDSSGNPVVSSSKECVKTLSSGQTSAKCGDVFDSDGDGVSNDKDKCPDTPKGVKVDTNGCPLDSDKDGVADFQDKCPSNTPAEVAAGVDASGCPIDSDGDGVADYRDKCPGTPAGTAVDLDGCPPINRVIETRVTEDLVSFDFDKIIIKPAGQKVLDKLVNFLTSGTYTIGSMSLIGHTDSIGATSYNQGLSVKRAQAVANYLSSQGVKVDMAVSGKGESAPIASNATRAGRSQNRRVDITIRASGPKK